MKGYVANIEVETLQNDAFRKVLFTAHHSQLVVMAIQPGDDIGKEVHDLDQFLRIEAGTGTAVLDGQEFEVGPEWAVVVPAGTEHNLVNTGTEVLKLYTVYSPPNHQDGTVHQTKADVTEEHFDGTVSF